MFTRFFLGIGVLVVTAAVLLLDAGTALAQRGGWRGGGVAGGYRGGSWSGYRGGWNGYRGGAYSGYRGWGGYRGYGLGVGVGLGYPGYYDNYRYGPGYSSGYMYAPTYASSMPPAYDSSSTPSPTYSSSAYRGPVTENTVHINVRVPNPNAQVWFDGKPTSQRGTMRQFESPQITPGDHYIYELRAQWNQNGRTVTQTRQIHVQAGTDLTVDFTRPQPSAPPPAPAPTGTASGS